MTRWDAIVAEMPAMRRYARGLVGNAHTADDLVQATAERAYHKWHLFQSKKTLRPWLFRILHNLYIDEFVRRPVIQEEPEPIVDSGIIELQRDLNRALNLLRSEYREIILLADLEEFSYREIAKILDIAQGTVMSRLSRARASMRQLLAPYQSTQSARKIR